MAAYRPHAASAAAGRGLGWDRVAQAVREAVPRDEVAGVWLFPAMRRESREWGTAVVARRAIPGRVTVLTAKYMMVVRGRERGQGKVEVEEVGEGPHEVVHDVIRGVQDRLGEAEPPVEISADIWYREGDDQSAPQG
jgi:hypothetical protein